MGKNLFIRSALTVFILVTQAPCLFADAPENGLEIVEKTMLADQKAQVEISSLLKKQQQLRAMLEARKQKQEWLEYQTEKYKKYNKAKASVILQLKADAEEAEAVKRYLLPKLDAWSAALGTLREDDRNDSAAELVNALQQYLDTPDYSLIEKFEKTVGMMLTFLDAAGEVTVADREVDTIRGPAVVQTIRMGRLAQFYRSQDGEMAGYWNRATGKWDRVDADEDAIRTSIEMTMGRRAEGIVLLPLAGGDQ